MKKKFLADILVLTTLSACVYAGAACSKEKEQATGTENSISVENTSTEESGMEVTETKSSKIRLMSNTLLSSEYEEYGVSPLADSAYTLEATVTPDYIVDFIGLDWTAEFQNPNSDWAKGKTVSDYVTVTPTSDGAHTATVECLQAFGEVIIIKALARGNEEVYGACTCNYILRHENIMASLEDGTSIYFEKGNTTIFSFEDTNVGRGKVTFSVADGGVGTKDTSSFTLSMEINDVLKSKLQAAGFTLENTNVTYDSYLSSAQLTQGTYGFETKLYLPGADAAILGETKSKLIEQGHFWATTGTNDDGVLSKEEWETYIAYRNAVMTAAQESDDFLIKLILTQYDKLPSGNVLTVYEAKMDMSLQAMLPNISATNIQLNYDNIDF